MDFTQLISIFTDKTHRQVVYLEREIERLNKEVFDQKWRSK